MPRIGSGGWITSEPPPEGAPDGDGRTALRKANGGIYTLWRIDFFKPTRNGRMSFDVIYVRSHGSDDDFIDLYDGKPLWVTTREPHKIHPLDLRHLDPWLRHFWPRHEKSGGNRRPGDLVRPGYDHSHRFPLDEVKDAIAKAKERREAHRLDRTIV